MCQQYSFYHVCGHVCYRTIIQCLDSIERVLSSHESRHLSHHSNAKRTLCTETPNEIEVISSTCELCHEVGVISEWLGNRPEARFDAVRSWKANLRRCKTANRMDGVVGERHQEVEREEEKHSEDGSDDSVETMECISTLEINSTPSSRTSASTPPPAATLPVLINATDLRARAARLTGRLLRTSGRPQMNSSRNV
jgi:hypothetical protein